MSLTHLIVEWLGQERARVWDCLPSQAMLNGHGMRRINSVALQVAKRLTLQVGKETIESGWLWCSAGPACVSVLYNACHVCISWETSAAYFAHATI